MVSMRVSLVDTNGSNRQFKMEEVASREENVEPKQPFSKQMFGVNMVKLKIKGEVLNTERKHKVVL